MPSRVSEEAGDQIWISEGDRRKHGPVDGEVRVVDVFDGPPLLPAAAQPCIRKPSAHSRGMSVHLALDLVAGRCTAGGSNFDVSGELLQCLAEQSLFEGLTRLSPSHRFCQHGIQNCISGQDRGGPSRGRLKASAFCPFIHCCCCCRRRRCRTKKIRERLESGELDSAVSVHKRLTRYQEHIPKDHRQRTWQAQENPSLGQNTHPAASWPMLLPRKAARLLKNPAMGGKKRARLIAWSSDCS